MFKMLFKEILFLNHEHHLYLLFPAKAPSPSPSHKHTFTKALHSCHMHKEFCRTQTVCPIFQLKRRNSSEHRCRFCVYSDSDKNAEGERERERGSTPQMHCTLSVFQVTKLGVDGRVMGKKFAAWERKESEPRETAALSLFTHETAH